MISESRLAGWQACFVEQFMIDVCTAETEPQGALQPSTVLWRGAGGPCINGTFYLGVDGTQFGAVHTCVQRVCVSYPEHWLAVLGLTNAGE